MYLRCFVHRICMWKWLKKHCAMGRIQTCWGCSIFWEAVLPALREDKCTQTGGCFAFSTSAPKRAAHRAPMFVCFKGIRKFFESRTPAPQSRDPKPMLDTFYVLLCNRVVFFLLFANFVLDPVLIVRILDYGPMSSQCPSKVPSHHFPLHPDPYTSLYYCWASKAHPGRVS